MAPMELVSPRSPFVAPYVISFALVRSRGAVHSFSREHFSFQNPSLARPTTARSPKSKLNSQLASFQRSPSCFDCRPCSHFSCIRTTSLLYILHLLLRRWKVTSISKELRIFELHRSRILLSMTISSPSNRLFAVRARSLRTVNCAWFSKRTAGSRQPQFEICTSSRRRSCHTCLFWTYPEGRELAGELF